MDISIVGIASNLVMGKTNVAFTKVENTNGEVTWVNLAT